MQIVHGEGLRPEGAATFWKVLLAGVAIGVLVARIFDTRPVRVVRFVDVPNPGGPR